MSIIKDYIGKIYNSDYGPYEVIREYSILIGYPKYSRLFDIKFLNTGFITTVTQRYLGMKSIKDHSLPSISNIGFYGNINIEFVNKDLYFKLQKTWAHMIDRCYNINNKSYQAYGAKGVTVDPRWHNFTNFYYDAQRLPGFENKLIYSDIYQLDKDYLQMNIPIENRVYSKDTCIWVSNVDNSIIQIIDKENLSGYKGVVALPSKYKDKIYCYYTRFDYCKIASFKTPEAAACYYNYLCIARQEQNPYCNLNLLPYILNNVYMIPLKELMSNKYLNNIVNESKYKPKH